MQKHERENSRYNSAVNWEEGITKLRLKKNTGFSLQQKMVERLKLVTKQHTCDPENNVKLNECINRVLEEKMNCNLPWVKNHFLGTHHFSNYDSFFKDKNFQIKDYVQILMTSKHSLILQLA